MKKIVGIAIITSMFLIGCGVSKPADLSDKEAAKLEKLANSQNLLMLRGKYQNFIFQDKNYRAQIIGKNLPNDFKKKIATQKQKSIEFFQKIIKAISSGDEKAIQTVNVLKMTGQLRQFAQIKKIKEDYFPQLEKALQKMRGK